MCAENVDKDCSMLCSSPMSEKTPSNIEIEDVFAGINKPDAAIKTNKPTIFSVTVLPPVFGPVIKSILFVFFPTSRDTGTTFLA